MLFPHFIQNGSRETLTVLADAFAKAGWTETEIKEGHNGVHSLFGFPPVHKEPLS